MTAPQQPGPVEQLADRLVDPDPALAVGLDVAATWAAQDRLDPHRPVLSQVVAEAIERRGMTGPRERATEALREQVEAEHRATVREQARADDAEATVAQLTELLNLVERVMRHSPNLRLIDTAIPSTAAQVRRHLGGMPAR